MMDSELDDVQKAVIFFLGKITRLHELGLVDSTEPTGHLTADGMTVFRELLAQGYSPPPDLLAAAVAAYRRLGDDERGV
jgi:hypothetical protein